MPRLIINLATIIVANVEGRLFDGNEKLYAHATSTCLIITL